MKQRTGAVFIYSSLSYFAIWIHSAHLNNLALGGWASDCTSKYRAKLSQKNCNWLDFLPRKWEVVLFLLSEHKNYSENFLEILCKTFYCCPNFGNSRANFVLVLVSLRCPGNLGMKFYGVQFY